LVEIVTKNKRSEGRWEVRNALIEREAKRERVKVGRKVINRLIEEKSKTEMSEGRREFTIYRTLETVGKGEVCERRRVSGLEITEVAHPTNALGGVVVKRLFGNLESVAPRNLSTSIKMVKKRK
jgi:hypothetical protein